VTDARGVRLRDSDHRVELARGDPDAVAAPPDVVLLEVT
jgi:hypothetical protein